MKLNAKRTLVTAVAALCIGSQITACGIETVLIGGAVAGSAIVLSDRRSIAVYSKDAWIAMQAATPLGATQSELERGVEIARTTSGVQRVVKTSLITIIQEPQAKALDQEAKTDAAKTQGTVTPLPEGQPVTQPTTQGVN